MVGSAAVAGVVGPAHHVDRDANESVLCGGACFSNLRATEAECLPARCLATLGAARAHGHLPDFFGGGGGGVGLLGGVGGVFCSVSCSQLSKAFRGLKNDVLPQACLCMGSQAL